MRAGLVDFAQAHVVGGVGRRMSGQNGVFFCAPAGRAYTAELVLQDLGYECTYA